MVEKELPEFAKSCNDTKAGLMVHHDLVLEWQMMFGKSSVVNAIAYAGIKGLPIMFWGTRGATFDDALSDDLINYDVKLAGKMMKNYVVMMPNPDKRKILFTAEESSLI